MNCNHESKITITAKSSGKSKTFCADCLYEIQTQSAPVEMPEGGFEEFSHDTLSLLMNGELTEWERSFLPSLGKMRQPTEKQLAIWTKIVRKYLSAGQPASAPSVSAPASFDDIPF